MWNCLNKFTENIPDPTILNLTNYGEIFHTHRSCQALRNDGSCRMTAQEENYFKKVLQQNPSSKRNNIIYIVNTNLNLIMDEQAQRQPIGFFTALGINIENEKLFNSRKFWNENYSNSIQLSLQLQNGSQLTTRCTIKLSKKTSRRINKNTKQLKIFFITTLEYLILDWLTTLVLNAAEGVCKPFISALA